MQGMVRNTSSHSSSFPNFQPDCLRLVANIMSHGVWAYSIYTVLSILVYQRSLKSMPAFDFDVCEHALATPGF